MPVTTSRYGTIVDALVAACATLPVFADPARVYDGPFTGGDTNWTSAVFVGFDGDWREVASGAGAGANYESGTGTQTYQYVGNSTVLETVEVHCVAESWTGESVLKTVRDQALAMWAGISAMIRVDPTLGIDGSTIASVSDYQVLYDYDNDGNVICRIPFTVHVVTTILTT